MPFLAKRTPNRWQIEIRKRIKRYFLQYAESVSVLHWSFWMFWYQGTATALRNLVMKYFYMVLDFYTFCPCHLVATRDFKYVMRKCCRFVEKEDPGLNIINASGSVRHSASLSSIGNCASLWWVKSYFGQYWDRNRQQEKQITTPIEQQ